MLETLSIKNYALIDDVEVDLTDGFNVLTGETGAGKSIIVGALNLVLGARAAGEVVRDGAAKASIDAVFRITNVSRRLARILKNHDIDLDGQELILSRTITPDGRSRGYVSGTLAPISVLAEIGDELVDLHGQHEHQSLLKPERQLDLLDGFAETEALAGEMGIVVTQLREIDRRIADLDADDRERARRAEFLRFEVSEIDAADLQPEEEAALKERRNLVGNAERICALAGEAYAALYEGEERPAIDALDSAITHIEELSQIDARFRALADQLTALRAGLEAVSGEVRNYTDRIEFDPEELDRVNSRLNVISALKRKYGDSIDAILTYRAKAAEEIDQFDRRDTLLEELRAQHQSLLRGGRELAGTLTKKRTAAAKRLDKQVTAALQDLGMKGGAFETHIEPVELCATGADRVEFYLAANPGERPKPLRQVASGGEISRIMLALKAVFAQADQIPTLIFDEIDSGVGGAVAVKVADKLRGLAATHQTICITHIPQIAAAANTHYSVAKLIQKGRTTTTVQRIENRARVEEVARLLDGSVSDVSVRHAEALLRPQ
ncbi:MAG: DNA repair protein RecN [Candidatus Hydrogenedentes bacterium]|nr:DNA repair protein RecN [Candidatus Hydrogenedentota bacterium]